MLVISLIMWFNSLKNHDFNGKLTGLWLIKLEIITSRGYTAELGHPTSWEHRTPRSLPGGEKGVEKSPEKGVEKAEKVEKAAVGITEIIGI